MGQLEVFEVLRRERCLGNDKYFGVQDIEKLLSNSEYKAASLYTVRGSLLKLDVHGYLDSRRLSDWRKEWRVKRKYVKKNYS